MIAKDSSVGTNTMDLSEAAENLVPLANIGGVRVQSYIAQYLYISV